MALSAEDHEMIRGTVRDGVCDGLKMVGIDVLDPMESQADFRFLRLARKASVKMILAAAGVIGVAAAGMIMGSRLEGFPW